MGICAQQMKRQSYKETGCWTRAEVDHLRDLFTQYDRDDSKEIGGDELRRMMEQEFPMLARDRTQQDNVKRLLQEADDSGNKKRNFDEYLRFFRSCADIQEHWRAGKEENAVRETGFHPVEVHQLRDLFKIDRRTGLPKTELSF